MADVPKVERLVNLVIALLETRRPLTLAEIKRRTGYYDGPEASARRKFERDKDELRTLGVPIETRATDAFRAPDGYIIDRRSYEQPDIELTPAEAAALAVVVRMTSEPDARLAMARLAARAPGDPVPTDAAPGARLRLGEGLVAELGPAIVERRQVTFTYRRGDGKTAARHVAPYAVVSRSGSWYLVGHDHDRDDIRAFRVDRITGEVLVGEVAGAHEIPEGFDPRPHLLGPVVPTDGVRIAVSTELAWEAQRRGGVATGEVVHDLQVHDFGTGDRSRLATWVVGNADRAHAIAPQELVDDVIERLDRLQKVLA